MSDSSSGYTIPIAVDFRTGGQQETHAAFQELQQQVSRTGNTMEEVAMGPLERMDTKAIGAGKSTKNLGMAANALSFQMQDFSVQVGMGTSAITAFAQQAPQLIDGLRMAGFMTGGFGLAMMGVSALLPVVSFGFKKLVAGFGEISEESKKFSEETVKSVKKAIDGIGAVMDAELQKTEAAAKSSIESARLLSEKFTEAEKAESAATTAALSNAEKNRKAQSLVAEMLGLQVDKYQELLAIAAATAAKSEEDAKAKTAAENEKLQKAEAAAWVKVETIKAQATELQGLESNLARMREQLSVLQAQRAEEQKILALHEAGKATPIQDAMARGYKATVDRIDPQIQLLQNMVDTKLAQIEKLKAQTATNEAAFENLQTQISDSSKAVATNIATIQANLAADTNLAKTTALAESQKLFASDLAASVGDIQTSTAASAAAKETILAAAADGKITADESLKVSAGLRTLLGSLQNGTATTAANVQSLIGIVARLQETAAAQRAQIDTLLQRR